MLELKPPSGVSLRPIVQHTVWREIYDITLNEKKWLKRELSICIIEFEVW